mmetsp:Transcript_50939/g.162987  ORF Transcript_50939/g.162987 Transcript_50939/m.162987 type:complete len:80 (+) Transcript_50939:1473-1712(+)
MPWKRLLVQENWRDAAFAECPPPAKRLLAVHVTMPWRRLFVQEKARDWLGRSGVLPIAEEAAAHVPEPASRSSVAVALP